MSSSKFSNPKWWLGLSMVGLPILAAIVSMVLAIGWKISAGLFGVLICITVVAVFITKGLDLMWAVEDEDL